MIDNAVISMILNHQEESDIAKFKVRMQAYLEWKAKHLICQSDGKTTVKAGDKIDVRDTEYIWCIGEVELKVST